MFPLTPELRIVLERQRELTEGLQRKQGRIIPGIFHRRGEPPLSAAASVALFQSIYRRYAISK